MCLIQLSIIKVNMCLIQLSIIKVNMCLDTAVDNLGKHESNTAVNN